jgi:hypothetical protein
LTTQNPPSSGLSNSTPHSNPYFLLAPFLTKPTAQVSNAQNASLYGHSGRKTTSLVGTRRNGTRMHRGRNGMGMVSAVDGGREEWWMIESTAGRQGERQQGMAGFSQLYVLRKGGMCGPGRGGYGKKKGPTLIDRQCPLFKLL